MASFKSTARGVSSISSTCSQAAPVVEPDNLDAVVTPSQLDKLDTTISRQASSGRTSSSIQGDLDSTHCWTSWTSHIDCGEPDALLDLAALRLQAVSPKRGRPTEVDAAQERPTKIMLGNIPGSFTRAGLEALLDQQGFAGLYDFTYVPMNVRTGKPFHFAFVNLVDGDVAVACKDALDGYAFDVSALGCASLASAMTMTTAWAGSPQGLQANVLRYRDSPLMHESVPDEYKPALFYRGVRVDFPAPTRALKGRPRGLRRERDPPEPQDVPGTRLCQAKGTPQIASVHDSTRCAAPVCEFAWLEAVAGGGDAPDEIAVQPLRYIF